MRLFRSQPRIALASLDEAAAIAGLYSRAWEGLRGKLDERLIADQTPGAEEVGAWLKGGFEVFTATLDGSLVGVVRCSFPTGTCLVDRMAVDPERNSNGSGRALAERAQGNGYMHEALQATNAYVFKELNMHRVMANFMPHNTRSNAVLRRLGFTIEGYARDYLFVNGAWRDHVLTSLTNPDWKPLD